MPFDETERVLKQLLLLIPRCPECGEVQKWMLITDDKHHMVCAQRHRRSGFYSDAPLPHGTVKV